MGWCWRGPPPGRPPRRQRSLATQGGSGRGARGGAYPPGPQGVKEAVCGRMSRGDGARGQASQVQRQADEIGAVRDDVLKKQVKPNALASFIEKLTDMRLLSPVEALPGKVE